MKIPSGRLIIIGRSVPPYANDWANEFESCRLLGELALIEFLRV